MRSRRPDSQAPPSSSDRLVRRTARGLAGTTLLLIVALLCGVGLATATVAIRATDASVDRSLRDASTAAIAYLELIDVDAPPTASPTPGPTTSQTPWSSEDAEPTDRNQPTDEEGQDDNAAPTQAPASPANGEDTEGPDGRVPATPVGGVVLAVSQQPEPTVTPLAQSEPEPDDQPPAASDTFFLVLDAQGQLLSNPRRVLLSGLPNAEAAAAAAANGEDWRTVMADGAPVRLFTKRVADGRGGPPALLQSGMVLSLQEVQRNEILVTIVLASLFGLLGAGLISLFVTRRALAPVRSAFASERRFVAAASHELRTPVALIHALAEVLQREDLVKPEGRQMLQDMIEETDQLGRLVGDLLALSSAEAGAVIVEPEPVEARSLVADLARRVEGMAAARGLSVALEQDRAGLAPQLMVLTDPNRLAQLLLVFVDNAIDHSPPGGVLRLSAGAGRGHGQGEVWISVADEGPGVPAAERERIFEPFARLDSRDSAAESTGLGLAIARSLADRLGATLSVDDAPGGGAIFSVHLPRRGASLGDAGSLPSAATRRERPVGDS